MPRIPYAHEGTEAAGATPYYQAIKAKFGVVPNLVKLVGHSGPATEALVGQLDVYFSRLTLPVRVREIAYLAAAKTNGCAYCQGHHTPLAQKAGLSAAQIDALSDADRAATVLSPEEAAVVRFSIETTRNVAASDAAHAALAEHFRPELIAEIAVVVASANFIQRIGRNFGVELEG